MNTMMLTVVDLPESTCPMTTTLMWVLSSLLSSKSAMVPGEAILAARRGGAMVFAYPILAVLCS